MLRFFQVEQKYLKVKILLEQRTYQKLHPMKNLMQGLELVQRLKPKRNLWSARQKKQGLSVRNQLDIINISLKSKI